MPQFDEFSKLLSQSCHLKCCIKVRFTPKLVYAGTKDFGEDFGNDRRSLIIDREQRRLPAGGSGFSQVLPSAPEKKSIILAY